MSHRAKMIAATRAIKQNLQVDPGVSGPLQWGTIASVSTGTNFDTAGVYLDSASGQPGAVITTGIPWINGYKPTVGDVVLILRMGGSARTQRVILGPLEKLIHGITEAGTLDILSILLNNFLTIQTAQAVAQTINFPTIRETETLAVQPQLVVSRPSSTPQNGALNQWQAMGLGGGMTITPQVTGRVKIRWSWNVSNGTSGDTTWTGGGYGTGTPPVVNATTGLGTQYGPAGGRMSGFTNGTYTYAGSFEDVITGLTLGTAYWFDLWSKVNGGTGTWSQIIGVIEEW